MEDDTRVAAGRTLLGRTLRERRKSAGVTLREAQARSGVSMSYLSEVERGLRLPTLITLLALADTYGCTVEALLHDVYPFGTARRPRRLPDIPFQPGRPNARPEQNMD